MKNKLIKLALDNWNVILNKKEAEQILDKYPNIFISYYEQNQAFKGIRPYNVLYKDIKNDNLVLTSIKGLNQLISKIISEGRLKPLQEKFKKSML